MFDGWLYLSRPLPGLDEEYSAGWEFDALARRQLRAESSIA
jgi:hypothetical protein